MKVRRLHRIVGLGAVAGLLLLTITGLLLNSPNVISELDSPRQMVAVGGKKFLLTESSLVFWTPTGNFVIPLRHPIAHGDRLFPTTSGIGVLHRDGVIMVNEDTLWRRVVVPPEMGWVSNIDAQDSSWIITTTTGVWESADLGESWRIIIGPYPESWKDTIRKLHSGWYFGWIGMWWINFTGFAILGLTATGAMLYRRRSKLWGGNHEKKIDRSGKS
ncbi:hypothetical protein EBR96_03630 [bacterium]|nr:hypothetical protein [bacterium]